MCALFAAEVFATFSQSYESCTQLGAPLQKQYLGPGLQWNWKTDGTEEESNPFGSIIVSSLRIYL